jgi:hypothetical protein
VRRSAPPEELRFGDVRVLRDPIDNRVRLFFPGKPSADVRSRLKSRGFRWAPSVGAWQRQATPTAWTIAIELAKGAST